MKKNKTIKIMIAIIILTSSLVVILQRARKVWKPARPTREQRAMKLIRISRTVLVAS